MILDLKRYIASFDHEVWYRFWLYDDEFKRETSINDYIRLFVKIEPTRIIYPFGYEYVVKNGDQYWYKNGQLHREGDAPAMIWSNGDKEWWKNGQSHRDGDEPAFIGSNGHKSWWKNDQRHRDGDEPAIIWSDGDKSWWKNGQRHRDGDEPAVIDANGRKEWWKHGQRHREAMNPQLFVRMATKIGINTVNVTETAMNPL